MSMGMHTNENLNLNPPSNINDPKAATKPATKPVVQSSITAGAGHKFSTKAELHDHLIEGLLTHVESSGLEHKEAIKQGISASRGEIGKALGSMNSVEEKEALINHMFSKVSGVKTSAEVNDALLKSQVSLYLNSIEKQGGPKAKEFAVALLKEHPTLFDHGPVALSSAANFAAKMPDEQRQTFLNELKAMLSHCKGPDAQIDNLGEVHNLIVRAKSPEDIIKRLQGANAAAEQTGLKMENHFLKEYGNLAPTSSEVFKALISIFSEVPLIDLVKASGDVVVKKQFDSGALDLVLGNFSEGKRYSDFQAEVSEMSGENLQPMSEFSKVVEERMMPPDMR